MIRSSAPKMFVCPFDPALDMTDEELQRYTLTRDHSLLKFHEGKAPTKYYIQRLSTSQMVYLQRQDKEHERLYGVAFCMGVVRVENLKRNDGVVLDAWEPRHVVKAEKDGMISSEEVDDIFDMPEVLDIGSVVYWHSFLGEKRRGIFVPPPSSPYAWASQRERSHLADIPTQTASSPKPNSDADPINLEKSEKTTDATATESAESPASQS